MVPAPTPTAAAVLQERQLWNPPAVTSLAKGGCPPFSLNEGGVISFKGHTTAITLQGPAWYRPNCSDEVTFGNDFYASTTVFIYVVAMSTVIAWILSILLLITQRTYHPGARPAPTTSGLWLQGRRRVPTAMISGRGHIIGGLGSRPWLQKVACLLVTLGLTVTSVEAFSVSHDQYEHGIISAKLLRDKVVTSNEVRILRVISGVFVWLAQVQTLMRLFPRRKEKLIIKWFGFLLILLDLIFSCLNAFLIKSKQLPRSYKDAIPALSYLFQLSISLLYMAWVFYYAMTKRRFAFFRSEDLSMTIVAILALVSIAIPVGFFVADVSVPPVASWGDFFRWVGAAAASIVVWEWVDRIEACEREEKKDGILGREVFDEDEIDPKEAGELEKGDDSSNGSGSGGGSLEKDDSVEARSAPPRRKGGFLWIKKPMRASRGSRTLQFWHPPRTQRHTNAPTGARKIEDSKQPAPDAASRQQQQQQHPPTMVPNRADTGSAESTVYTVMYHAVQGTPPATTTAHAPHPSSSLSRPPATSTRAESGQEESTRQKRGDTQPSQRQHRTAASSSWAFATNAFKRRKRSPPIEVKQALSMDAAATGTQQQQPPPPKMFFAGRSAALSYMGHPTVIPAPPRGHTWSPAMNRHSPSDPVASPDTEESVSPPVPDDQNDANTQEPGGQAIARRDMAADAPLQGARVNIASSSDTYDGSSSGTSSAKDYRDAATQPPKPPDDAPP